MRAPSQRHALGALFSALALGFAAIAALSAVGADGSFRRWIVAAAAAAIAVWFASIALPLVRRR